MKKYHYITFNGLHKAHAKKYYTPKDLKEFIENICNKGKIRIFGSMHTFNDMSLSNNVLINTVNLNKILNISSTEVKVEAGIKLYVLLEKLKKYNLTLPVVPSISNISIVGGISTGAHGSNINYGSFSSLVTSAEIIKDNKVETVSDLLLKAIRCSLGCIAPIYSITLKTVPLFSIKEKKVTMTWKKFYDNFDNIMKKYEYTQAYVSQELETPVALVLLRKKIKYDPKLKNILTGVWNEFYIEIELAFPLDILNDAVHAVINFHKEYKKKNNVFTESDLLIRFSDADDTLISMASERKTVYISTFFDKEYKPEIIYRFMNDLNNEMTIKYKARPHYGKIHSLDNKQMAHIYEHYDEFKKVKDEYDKNSVFSNNYIDRLF